MAAKLPSRTQSAGNVPGRIAIIGCGCRLPGGVNTSSKLWELLREPRDLSEKISSQRFNPEGFYHENGAHRGTSNVMNAYLLGTDHRHFDARFFQTKPSEANAMDPQQRILLETVYGAIESSGLKLSEMRGSDTAVYVGAMGGDYNDLILRGTHALPTYLSTGTARSILSNRISYFFDWHGPSLTVDTACSSSLVALDEAVQVLQRGKSRVAVVAGSNLILGPETFIAESSLNMLSPTGRCRMWDASADGYARGEGFVAMILKRLEDALEDRDHIEAVVCATGVNQDGRTKGITSPSSAAQASLIRQVYRSAGLDVGVEADRCQYLEAHGTGTPLGDPTEAAAIENAFFQGIKDGISDAPLYVGSIKTVIGHTEGTAGLAGVLKATLALKYGFIPPNLHFHQLSPRVEPFYQHLRVPQAIIPWPKLPEGAPRRASVNSFGFGGTNAHIILESFPMKPVSSLDKPVTMTCPSPFNFSAASEKALRRSVGTYVEYLKSATSIRLDDLAFTLSRRRSSFPYRWSTGAFSKESLIFNMSSWLEKEITVVDGREKPKSAGILGIFTGQGAQWAGMAQTLIKSSPLASNIVDELDKYLQELQVDDRPDWSLREELLRDASSSRINESQLAQPLCTAVQIVLVDLLHAAKVKLTAVVGHSSGEIAAAYATGYLPRRDALYVAYFRGVHTSASRGPKGEPGAMMVVETTAADAYELCDFPGLRGRVSVAAVNSTTNVTLSGDQDAILIMQSAFQDEGKYTRILKVDKAYHSHHMIPCATRYLAALSACDIHVQECESRELCWFSSVHGSLADSERGIFKDTYWERNMVQPVLFREAVANAVNADRTYSIVVEIGPHPALKRPVLQTFDDYGSEKPPYIVMLRRGQNSMETISKAFGAIWSELGDEGIDIESLLRDNGCKPSLLKGLPPYSWDHDRIYWHESQTSRAFRQRPQTTHELLGAILPDGTTQQRRWRNVLSLEELPWLQGHKLQGLVVFPAAGYIVMALESCMFIANGSTVQIVELKDVRIERPIIFDDQTVAVEIMFTLTDISHDLKKTGFVSAKFDCFAALPEGSPTMTLMAYGKVRVRLGEFVPSALSPRLPEPSNLIPVDTDRLYSSLSSIGYEYTRPFCCLSNIRRKYGVARGTIDNPLHHIDAKSSYLIHPSTLDSAIQGTLVAYSWPGDGMLASIQVPTHIERVVVNVPLSRSSLLESGILSFDCELAQGKGRSICGDIGIYPSELPDGDNYAFLRIEGLHNSPVSNLTEADDRIVFEEVCWGMETPDATKVTRSNKETALALLADHVSFRYPHMSILEVSDRGGSVTTKILSQIGTNFGSYTLLLPFRDDVASHGVIAYPNTETMTLNIHSEVSPQQFLKHAYDVAIVNGFGDDTKSIECMARNLHLLLKPGGHLLLAQPLGCDALSQDYFISSGQFNTSLLAAGFSGIDSMSNVPGATVITTQALDYRMVALRKPLLYQWEMLTTQSIFIICNHSSSTSTLVNALRGVLVTHLSDVVLIDGLDNPAITNIPSDALVISLVDLEGPVLHRLTPIMLRGLISLLDQSRVILWVTNSCQGDDPYASMIVGFGRTLLLERTNLHLQFLDVSSALSDTAERIAESLLRLRGGVEWLKHHDEGKIPLLWTIEPELSLGVDGLLMIPRVMPCQERNDRYNSGRREITKQRHSSTCIIETRYDEAAVSYTLVQRHSPVYAQSSFGIRNLDVVVRYSSLLAIMTENSGYLFVVLGEVPETGDKVLGFSEIQASRVSIPPEWCVPISKDSPQQDSLAAFAKVCNILFAAALLSRTAPGDVMLVHEPPHELALALLELAQLKSVTVRFLTTSSTNLGLPWLYCHPDSSSHSFKSRLPRNISVFITNSQISEDIQAKVSSILPRSHLQLDLKSVFSRTASVSALPAFYDERQRLRLSCVRANPTANLQGRSCDFGDLPNFDASLDEMVVVDWTVPKVVTTKLNPVDSDAMFSRWKTYLLVGLAGELGQSLAGWMVKHGARFIVLTSRTPRVDQSWLDSFENTGATIHVYTNDVTNKTQLQMLIREIEEILPPIAGVANGAMVLEDTPVAEIDVNKFEKVLRPKVQGSANLDDVFGATPLEFFILFSSVAAIVGNKGQSSYSAANAFMCSLATRRRKRGLAASVIHIGAIVGTGYLTREVSQNVQDYLRKAGYLWMSEHEFHQVFAEGVLASDPISSSNHEILSGIHVGMNGEDKAVWYANPKFQHCVSTKTKAAVHRENPKYRLPLKKQIESALYPEEVRVIIADRLSRKLEETLLMDAQPGILEMTADELGIDSLVATTLRSWFLTDLAVDIPIMKILSGMTFRKLLDYAVDRLPQSILPTLPNDKNSHISYESKPSIIEADDLLTQPELAAHPIRHRTTMAANLFPLSFAQLRFWFLQSLLEDKTTFNVTCMLSLTGPLIVDQLERAVDTVGQRHEGLRTSFLQREGKSWQCVLKKPVLHLETKAVISEPEALTEFQRMEKHIFDLEAGETMKILLLVLSPLSHYLIISYHHINMDGASLVTLVKDLANVYVGEKPLDPLIQYPRYSEQQHQDYDSGKWQRQVMYWKREYSDLPPPLPILSLSHVTTRKPLDHYDSYLAKAQVGKATRHRIGHICGELKVTAFQFFVTIFRTLLVRFSGVEDLCIGIVEAGRKESASIGSIGNFINVLPLRLRSPLSCSFADGLRETCAKACAALLNADVPIDILLTELGIERDARQMPLFQSLVDYRNVQEKQKFGDCEVQGLLYSVGRTGYDISMDIIDDPAGDCTVTMMVQKNIYTEHVAQILLEAFLEMTAAFSEDTSLTLKFPALYSPARVADTLSCGRGPLFESKWTSLPEAVDYISQSQPEAIALKDGHGSLLTYKELTIAIDCIANALLGIIQELPDAEPRVAVLQIPGVHWVCSMLAIMKVGAAYVPLDLRSGIPRCTDILEESKASIILAHFGTMSETQALGYNDRVTVMDVDWLLQCSGTVGVLSRANSASIAAIIYTSGTSGTPKGIALTHGSLQSHMESVISLYDFKKEVVLQQSAQSFDASIFQVYLAMLTGGVCYIAPTTNRMEPSLITESIVAEGITTTIGVPSEYLSWLRYGDCAALKASAYRMMISVGEPFTRALAHQLQMIGKHDLRVLNMYGPSEVTFASSAIELSYNPSREISESIPLAGHTLPNYSVYILDNDLKPVPAGVPGQIAVSGAICSGYVNGDVTNSKQFVPNPFAQQEWNAEKWGKLYLTGDRGRFRESSGMLLFEGRIEGDTQIKLRGIRIEMQDIESNIISYAEGHIAEAIVSSRGEPPEFLVAHVVLSTKLGDSSMNGFELDLDKLLDRLPLPRYMRPAVINIIDAMPYTISGKIDRKAIGMLPLPSVPGSIKGTSKPLNPIETRLKSLWQSVLSGSGIPICTIDAQSDFFRLGGNSLLLIKLRYKIQESLGACISLLQLFEATCLSGMAATISHAQECTQSPRWNIDWNNETQVENLEQAHIPTYPAPHDSVQTVSETDGKNVVITGATGLLGRHILNALIDAPDIGRIDCIAVRHPEQLQRLANDRLGVYAGDLSDPYLGLSPPLAELIFSTADIIIHSGADVSFLKNYSSLRKSNVESTKALCRMIFTFRRSISTPAMFHYISTVGVAQLDSQISEFRPVSVASLLPPQDGTYGYVASKWASEIYLERLARHDLSNQANQLPASLQILIHRPSTIMTSDPSRNNDVVPNIITYCRRLCAVPQGLENCWKGWIDWVDIDQVVDGVMKHITSPPHASQSPTYFHHSGGNQLPVGELKSWLENREGTHMKEIPFDEWIQNAKQAGLDEMVAAYLEGISQGNAVKSPRVLKE
ncbi:putative acyl transferase acyl hydrolase lysophospholipase [Rosellinia necatrix]|uniref:Putative acyl transferase acyl hydrolase lysophospholipase n=1 Tax=Rosellinia necatrix TaxID=77044 RepID=A0A1S7UQ25_ROSNE|nr:putative acyl transferase acyl hydrolase lysophospholipase [Rosellinia necatrix]